jgi:cytochrome c biogenesis protein CcdA
MLFTAVAFLAGVLTVLTPCVFVILPVILGTSLARARKETPYLVVGGLVVSVVLFTVLLKISTIFIDIDMRTWSYVTACILLYFGVSLVIPDSINRLTSWMRPTQVAGSSLLSYGKKMGTRSGDILIGVSLGPIFSSCSPTYFLILATVFPLHFGEGLFYTFVYASGLGLMLLIVALLGTHAVTRLRLLADPNGMFKRVVGMFFIGIALLVGTGTHIQIERYLLDIGLVYINDLEYTLIERLP